MRSRKFLFYVCGLLLVAGTLAFLLTPLVVAGGLRWWLDRAARQEGMRVELANECEAESDHCDFGCVGNMRQTIKGLSKRSRPMIVRQRVGSI